VFYSTPAEYTDAKLAQDIDWPVVTNDFFPYVNMPRVAK
jgi:hypothetical protein